MMFRRASEPATDFFDGIVGDLFDAADLMGAQVVDSWRERISVDVEYQTGPRGGLIVIRSKVGEAPRRETGDLYNSIQSDVEIDLHAVTLDVSSDKFYAPILEDKLGRPHIDVTLEEWAEPFFDAMVDAINKGH